MIEIANGKIVVDGGKVLFEDFNLDVKKGEFVTLLGKTGIGKTTILRIIAGLTKLQKGSIKIDGAVSICFQDLRLFPNMTVSQNISYPLKIKNIDNEIIKSKTIDMARNLEIENLLDRDIENLSGGELRRVAIARALINDPDILLLDEATSNLDFETKKQVRDIIKKVHRDTNCTVVMVTHDIIDSLILSDRIMFLTEGRVNAYVKTKDIKNNEGARDYLKPYLDDINNEIIKNIL